MAKSDNLRAAKENKNDEFYTRLDDIKDEIVQHKDYVRHFEGKTVLCNCDDPEWSNFVEFFIKFFKKLKLKRMIATHYNKDGSPSYKLEWSGEKIKGDTVNLIKTPLKGNGDFRSEECIELLKEADIVVTNPPFSLFREYVAQLVEYRKEFIILGNPNAIAYKEFFPLLKDNNVCIGYKSMGSDMYFIVSEEHKKELLATKKEGSGYKIINGEVFGRCQAIWYTNLDLDKSHEPLILTKNYYGNEQKYPKYENYDAIECGKVADIPKDYFPCWYDCPSASVCEYAKSEGRQDSIALCEQFGNSEQLNPCNGEVGVPITYMANHCEDQFEIVGDDTELAEPIELANGKHGNGRFYVNDEKTLDKSETAPIIADSTAQHSTAQHSTAQHSTAQHSTAQHKLEDYTVASSSDGRRHHKCSGIIGVPITFLADYCIEQFYIIGLDRYTVPKADLIGGRLAINGKPKYARILIKRKM